MDIRVISQSVESYNATDRATIFASRISTDQHCRPFDVKVRVGFSGYAEVVLATVPLSNEEMFEVSEAVIEREREDVFQGSAFIRAHERGL